jgi:hypothetical protein
LHFHCLWGNKKGYRCLDRTTNKFYLSQSVIFDETHFPAKSKFISQGSCKVTASSSESLVFLPSSPLVQFDLPLSPFTSLSNDALTHLNAATPSIDPVPQQIHSTESTPNNAKNNLMQLDIATHPTTQSPNSSSQQNSTSEITATNSVTTNPETTLYHSILTSVHISQLQEISSSPTSSSPAQLAN